MSAFDTEIYSSHEYKARIERAKRSLLALPDTIEMINIAAESMAYWQMRAIKIEEILLEEGVAVQRGDRKRDE